MTNDDVSAICPNVQHGQQHAAHKRAQASASERRTAITMQNSVHDMGFALICRIARKSTRRPEEEGRELRQQSPQPSGSAQQSHIPVLQGPCAEA